MFNESLKDFYAGQSVFLTGGTGFIGKVLIEKLLRSCPGIEKIYILVRPKYNKSLQERLKVITDTPLFDTLKEINPEVIKTKIIPLAGDVKKLKLGLSEEDRQLLIENVSIIFHAAASVRFDDPLNDAILMNTRGTREIINLGLEIKNLKVFVHVSTTYCNTDKSEVEERLYPPHADWRKSIEIAENVDKYDVDLLTTKYIDVLPNTYTFTKSLAEHVVTDLCTNKIPAVVFRPSIVISSKMDPVPGWIDNFNGPVGLLVASGKGIVRTCYTNPKLKADYMPVDIGVRALLMSAWRKGITMDPEERLKVDFYNCSNNNMHTVTMGELIDLGKKIYWEVPLSNVLWIPGGGVTGCKYWNYLRVIFLHLLPATIIDALLRLTDRKPLLVKIQRRVYIANMALQYFITNQWAFINDKVLALEKNLIPSEVEDFGYDLDNVDVYDYFRNCVLHGRRFLLNESYSNIEDAKKNLYRMYVLDKIVKALFFIFLYWYFIHTKGGLSYIGNKFNNAIEGWF